MPEENTRQTGSIPTSHIDIGGIALPRDEMQAVLPDIQRFEAHLTDALAVDSYMKHGDGSIPDYVQQWSQERIAAVIATLNEIGSLREQVSEQIKDQQGNTAQPRTGTIPTSASSATESTTVQPSENARHDH